MTVIDDYGHHPTELAATLAAARAVFPGRRLVAAFQPHRYSRTKALFEEFGSALCNADQLFLTEIYPASEKPIPGITGKSLAEHIASISKTPVRFYPTLDGLLSGLDGFLKPDDVLLTLGAGSITKIAEAWLEGRASA